MKQRIKLSAFTVVELSIVIAIIAVLFSIASLSFMSTEKTARANVIVSNMTTLRMLYQAANMRDPDLFGGASNGAVKSLADLHGYVDVPNMSDRDKYSFEYYSSTEASDKRGWWIRYSLENDDSNLRQELQDTMTLKPELGILVSNGLIENADSGDITNTSSYIIMKAQ